MPIGGRNPAFTHIKGYADTAVDAAKVDHCLAECLHMRSVEVQCCLLHASMELESNYAASLDLMWLIACHIDERRLKGDAFGRELGEALDHWEGMVCGP